MILTSMAVVSKLSMLGIEEMASKGSEEVQENTCIVCYKGVEIYSIGQCDHPVCYECSTRMRVLCLQNECPICRQDMPTVIFTEHVRPYREPKHNNLLTDKKFKIVFDSEKVQKAYHSLLAHTCPKCDGKSFQTFGQLREHVRRVHQLNFCDLCVENLKILTRERRCYTRQELAMHRRQGDPDDRSHRGHPLCQFCDTRFMDNDELYRHLRRNHLYCHFCDADGYDHYYSTYDFLRDHFRSEHFLCEEGECYDEKFTAVFRTEIDLKAHRASVHGQAIGKAGVKQARTLELEFTLAPRLRLSRGNRNIVRQEELELGAVGGTMDDMTTQLKTDCMEEFPSLNGKGSGGSGGTSGAYASSGGTGGSHQSKVTATIRSSARGFTINDENFPALGPEATLSLHVNSDRPISSVVNTKPPNLSIHVNHRTSSFTTRVSSSSSHSHSHFEHNFPALSGSAKVAGTPVMSVASTQWSSGKKPDPKLTTIKQKTESGQKQSAGGSSRPRTFHMENDFPSLGSQPASSGGHAEPSNSKLNKASTAGAAPAPPPNLPPPPHPPLSTTNAQSSDSDAVPVPVTITRNKKKKSKSKNNNNTNNGNNNSNTATETKKTAPLNKSNKHNITLEEKESGEKSKKKSNGPNKSQNSAEGKATNKSENVNNGVVVDKSNNKASGDSSASTSAIDSNVSNIVGPSEKKKEEKKKCSSKGAPVFSEEEFPSFTRSRPPGFSDVVRVPPGFDVAAAASGKWPLAGGIHLDPNKPAPPPPPGFSPVHTETNLFSQIVDHYSYVSPSGFIKRNRWLVSMINNFGSPKLNDLQEMSGAFRCGLVSADQYFTHCQNSMGTNFDELFPELLALLPDINKQQELWPLYQKMIQSKEVSKKHKLECCATCGQVVKSFDLRDHRSNHALETHFPVLNGGLTSSAMNPQQLVNNAWYGK